ncbi:MAG: FAD-binding oxidoreductase [Pseudomonadales bacterium]|nr:FAD-binding oxidoreductase [Pseudomonadales bacterium]
MNDVVEALKTALGDAVSTDEAEREANGRDYWARSELQDWVGATSGIGEQDARPAPRAVVAPSGVDALAEAVRICRAHRVPMIPRGAGSGVCGGVLASPDAVVLSTARMTGMREFDGQDLLARFGAGTLGSDAEAAVAAEGCTIGNWPQSIDRSSVGGWVATRASGQYSTAYGNTEDMVYALEAVLPDGSVFRSRDTPRAAAGPDLRQLLLGSEGTLGIVTEVTFSLRRQPEHGVRQAFHFADFATGIDTIRDLMVAGWRPPVVRLYDARETWRHFSGACPKGHAMLIFLHEGPRALAELEAASVAALCRAREGAPADPAAVDRWFEHRNSVPSWRELFEQGLVVDTIEVATSWSRLAALYAGVIDALNQVPNLVAASAHSSHAYRSGANLYFSFAVAPADRDGMLAAYDACWNAAMRATVELGGGIAHHHGVGRVRRDWLLHELGPTGVRALRALKRALDPDGLMNPGVLIPLG